MGLNSTPSGERVHIGFFGRRNAGKSSVVNAITGQSLAVVSDVLGTTTDPVQKAMELLPLGPVVIIDTPGLDDEGELGQLRVEKAYKVLRSVDVAVVVVDSSQGLSDVERTLISQLSDRGIPYIVVMNKSDLAEAKADAIDGAISVSAATGHNIEELKERLAALARGRENERHIVSDIISAGDTVVLVTPIDASAPKGRLILPQQQTIRDILDADGVVVVTKETKLGEALGRLREKPALVITDSQVFGLVARELPRDIPLTSFSILFARYKGLLADAVKGAAVLDRLSDKSRILIAEGCTHHRQCEDIGTVKLPGWIKKYIGKDIEFSFASGKDFPQDIESYDMIIHCGGCMLNEREMSYRMRCARDKQRPISNYGTVRAYMNGILKRTLEPFPDILAYLD